MKKNLFYALTLMLATSFAFTSCGNKTKNTENVQTAQTAMQVDDVLQSADSLVGKVITLEGVCTHTCKHGGKKMFLMGSDDTKTMRVDASQQIGSFPAEVVNSLVEVTGKLVEERIDESVIRGMEEQYKNAEAEKHGENAEAGCTSEKSAHGQKELNSFEQRMKDYRDRIAQRKEKEGKEYLSFYALKGESYKVK